MKRYVNKAVLAVILVGLATCSSMTAYGAGDAEAGKEKSAVCAACHGVDGVSLIPANPSLAGQVPGYIKKQLAAFKSGERQNGVMLGMSVNLTEQDMADLDAYYVSQEAPKGSIAEDQKELAEKGEKIYRGGFAKREIAACMGCHGPSGHGIPTIYPRVAGQHQSYLEAQLLAFKKGERKGYNDIMWEIAFGLSEEQIKALAVYMSGLN